MQTATRAPTGWQLILADLALILFLVTAAALAAGSSAQGEAAHSLFPKEQALAPSQALFRSGPGLPSLAEWLARQSRDPRAALTIIAEHAPGEQARVWDEARQMAAVAAAQNIRARVIIRPASKTDIYASLAYDQPAG